MPTKNKKIVALLLLLNAVGPISAQEENEVLLGRLRMANHVGMCGVIIRMVHFLTSTQMAGSQEFVQGFIKTEAERLGLTHDELSLECDATTIETYNSLIRSLEQPTPKVHSLERPTYTDPK